MLECSFVCSEKFSIVQTRILMLVHPFDGMCIARMRILRSVDHLNVHLFFMAQTRILVCLFDRVCIAQMWDLRSIDHSVVHFFFIEQTHPFVFLFDGMQMRIARSIDHSNVHSFSIEQTHILVCLFSGMCIARMRIPRFVYLMEVYCSNVQGVLITRLSTCFSWNNVCLFDGMRMHIPRSIDHSNVHLTFTAQTHILVCLFDGMCIA